MHAMWVRSLENIAVALSINSTTPSTSYFDVVTVVMVIKSSAP